MRVSIRSILRRKDEQVVLECVKMTKDFEDIQEYAMMKGNILVGYIHDTAHRLELDHILYFEAVGDQVFAYTSGEVYSVKNGSTNWSRSIRIGSLSAAPSLCL